MARKATVHFDFVVDVEQADIIYEGVRHLSLDILRDIIHTAASLKKADKEQRKEMRAEIRWLKRHLKWLNKIPPKMKGVRTSDTGFKEPIVGTSV